MIEINMGSLEKAKKRVWVKPTAKRVGHYREQIVGRKEEKKVKSRFSELLNSFENRFGETIIREYREDLAEKSDDEIRKDFITLSHSGFGAEVIKPWFHGIGMNVVDGWITKELGLSEKQSRWATEFCGEAKDISDSENLMKFYLLNQEILKRKFPNGEITLFRGFHGEIAEKLFNENNLGDNVVMDDWNLSSWTEVPDVAEFFSVIPEWDIPTSIHEKNYGAIVKVTLPIEDILMSTRLVKEYYDGNDPSEVIVISPKLSSELISIKEYKDKVNIKEVHDEYYNNANNYWESIK